MSPEELAELRKIPIQMLNKSVVIPALLTHIDSQARRIATLCETGKTMAEFYIHATLTHQENFDVVAQICLDALDRIEAMQTELIEYRAILDYIKQSEGHDYLAHTIVSDGERSEAKRSLVNEHTNLFQEEA
jgi:hypothetical protein